MSSNCDKCLCSNKDKARAAKLEQVIIEAITGLSDWSMGHKDKTVLQTVEQMKSGMEEARCEN